MADGVRDIELHLPVLRRFALVLSGDPVRADDLVRACATRAIQTIDEFEEGTNLRAWLFTHLRRLHTEPPARFSPGVIGNQDEARREMDNRMPETQLMSVELQEFARRFQQMSRDDQDVILLVAVDGMSYADVADILQVPIGTVKKRLNSARMHLRRRYSEG